MKPHKHAELIKAWADGATIQYKGANVEWKDIPTEYTPRWDLTGEFRIKPEPKPEPIKTPMYIYYTKSDAKMWIDDNPPEKFLYNSLYTYVGQIEVLK